MKQIRFFLLSVVLMLPLKSSSQTWEWARSAGGTNTFGAFRSNQGTAICTDNSGNIYVAGFFSGTLIFGKDTLNSYINIHPVLMKYDRSGNPVWARQTTDGGSDYAYGVCIDPKQNVCVTGIKSGPGIAVFTAEYDSKGNLLWRNETSGKDYENRSRSVVADKKGNFYVAGDCKGRVTFDTFSIGALDEYTIYIAKYSPAGKVLWVKHSIPSDKYRAEACALAIDNAGNLYLAGEFAQTLTFEKTVVSTKGSFDAFMAKFNDAGRLSWVNTFGGTGKDCPRSIVVDAKRNVYLTAFFGAPCSGNRGLMEGENLLKFDPNGKLAWNKQICKAAVDYLVGSHMAVDNTGNVFLTGYKYYDEPLFGELAGTSNGSSDLFVAKCSSNGKLLWKLQAGGTDGDEGSAICVDKDGSIYVTGIFTTQIDLGNYTLKSNSRHDGIFVGKLK
jgi:hypothetical protein